MGCAASSEDNSDAPGESASDGGDIKMFSAESHALANTKLGGKHYGQASAHNPPKTRDTAESYWDPTEHSPSLLTGNGEG
jgi:hypothetical protein